MPSTIATRYHSYYATKHHRQINVAKSRLMKSVVSTSALEVKLVSARLQLQQQLVNANLLVNL